MTGTNLEEVVRIFDDSGTPLEGLDLDPEAAMKWVEERYPGQPFCLVRHWSILNIAGFPVQMLYADRVVHDSQGRCNPGDWVRSSAAIVAPAEGFFRTCATVYVLLGPGLLKERIDPELVLSIH